MQFFIWNSDDNWYRFISWCSLSTFFFSDFLLWLIEQVRELGQFDQRSSCCIFSGQLFNWRRLWFWSLLFGIWCLWLGRSILRHNSSDLSRMARNTIYCWWLSYRWLWRWLLLFTIRIVSHDQLFNSILIKERTIRLFSCGSTPEYCGGAVGIVHPQSTAGQCRVTGCPAGTCCSQYG